MLSLEECYLQSNVSAYYKFSSALVGEIALEMEMIFRLWS